MEEVGNSICYSSASESFEYSKVFRIKAHDSMVIEPRYDFFGFSAFIPNVLHA